MARRSLQWPKLIGVILGLEALGIFMCQARLLLWRWPEDFDWPTPWNTYLWLLFATFLLLLGYFVYRAHNWARLTAICLCFCLGAVILSEFVLGEVTWANDMPLSRVIEHALDHCGRFLSFFAPLAFIIAVLCHRDVAATFRPSITDRSNETMQRTPTRRSRDIFMTKLIHLRSALASGRRR
jgi:hypothetical protein